MKYFMFFSLLFTACELPENMPTRSYYDMKCVDVVFTGSQFKMKRCENRLEVCYINTAYKASEIDENGVGKEYFKSNNAISCMSKG